MIPQPPHLAKIEASLSKLIALVLFCFIHQLGIAQSDSTKTKETKVKEPFTLEFRGIRAGTDIYTLAFTALEPDFFGYEINADASFGNRLFTTFDWGYQKAERENEANTYVYTNQGNFFRLGIEYNIMHRKFSEDAIFLGLKYGIATFEHQIDYQPASSYWGTDNQQLVQNGLSAQWAELNLGLKVKVVKDLYLAIVLRTKFQTSLNEKGNLSVSEIPGFGINKNTVRGGLSYQVLYRLPFKKQL